ncbi:hypothetical protein ACTWQL_09615 [Pseudalkalibacillus sp. R45]|uniref:hypothetical protein n=1 Tax=Pseudalkalibacillus sp. R45 TaxID=3457433 RepID=UPI003FCE1D14
MISAKFPKIAIKHTHHLKRLISQDKESFGSVTSHEENAIFIFEESRTLLSNQLAQGESIQKSPKSNNL